MNNLTDIESIKKLLKKRIPFEVMSKGNSRYFQGLLIVLYLFVRQNIGIQPIFIYFFALMLVVMRLAFARIALIFFIITLVSYLVKRPVEANYYLSFTFLFLVAAIVKELVMTLIKGEKE